MAIVQERRLWSRARRLSAEEDDNDHRSFFIEHISIYIYVSVCQYTSKMDDKHHNYDALPMYPTQHVTSCNDHAR